MYCTRTRGKKQASSACAQISKSHPREYVNHLVPRQDRLQHSWVSKWPTLPGLPPLLAALPPLASRRALRGKGRLRPLALVSAVAPDSRAAQSDLLARRALRPSDDLGHDLGAIRPGWEARLRTVGVRSDGAYFFFFFLAGVFERYLRLACASHLRRLLLGFSFLHAFSAAASFCAVVSGLPCEP